MTNAPAPKSTDELVAQYFDTTADYWKEVYARDTLEGVLYRQRRDAVLAFVDGLSASPNTAALEVGCGAGFTSVALAQRAFRVDAVDTVPAMVRMTAEAASANGVANRLRASLGDIHSLDFPPAQFDLALAIGVMEWSADYQTPLRELHRVLKPGGHLITNVDNAWALHCMVDPRMSLLFAATKRSLRRAAVKLGLLNPLARPTRCPRAKLDRAIQNAGFTIVSNRTTGFGPFTMLGFPLLPEGFAVRLHHRLQKSADTGTPFVRNWGDAYLVLARKPAATP